MSFLNLMKNRLKPKEVNEALTKAVENALPDVEATDEGKVLAVNSSGKWVATAIPTSDVEIVQYTIDSIATASYGWIEPVPDENGNPVSTNDDIIDMTLLTAQNYVKFMPTRAKVNGVDTWIAKSFSINTMSEVTTATTYTGLKITILRHNSSTRKKVTKKTK